jgi:predicted 3-demethylubiquinone-9 3-methyltransferase (glyoxalase superfamily)
MSAQQANKVTTVLWFKDNAKSAAEYYCEVIPGTEIVELAPGPDGEIVVATISIFGTEYLLMNGGDTYKLSPAISLMIHCDTQDEIDHLWSKLGEGGEYLYCGWLTDQFGLTWQITPNLWWQLTQKANPAQKEALWTSMMESQKLVIADLQAAFDCAPA